MNKKLLTAGCFAVIFALIFRFLPTYYYKQGKSDYERKNYIKAYENLSKAYNFDKNNKDYRYYYVHSMMNLKPNKTIQQNLFKISTDSQNDSAHYAAEKQIRVWKYNVLRNIGNNYIEQVTTDNKIMRWSRFPLKIAIINNSGDDIPDYYKNEIIRAFSQWQKSTGFIKFEETNNSSSANIVIEIKQLPDNVCNGNVCRFVLGYTTPEYSGKILKRMNIIIYNKNPFGKFFTSRELYNTVLHEIGHSLGIMGHSYNTNDLMYMSAGKEDIYTEYKSDFQYLSEQDINTVTLLYKLIPDITDSENINTEGLVYAPIILGTPEEISNRKLQEAQNYIKNAPDLAGGYIDLGIAYSELNKDKEAIDAMLKAYELSKTNNEKYMSLFNLAAIYLTTGNQQKAKEYAVKAQQISDTEEIRELISNIR